MKIFSAENIRKIDEYTIKNEPVPSIELMERAATTFYKWLTNKIELPSNLCVVSGEGNNGGDGLAFTRIITQKLNIPVSVYIIKIAGKPSKDFKINYTSIIENSLVTIKTIKSEKDIPNLQSEALIIDAIFGSGLNRPVEGFIAKMIESINNSNAIVASIDIPSGLFSDNHSNFKHNTIVKADYTLAFEFPKFAFFMPENEDYIGKWEYKSIGLHQQAINDFPTNDYYLSLDCIKPLIKNRKIFAHKGHFGHGLLIAGSYGKIGAGILASQAALKSGIGLLTWHIPQCGYSIAQTATPETMLSIDKNETHFSFISDIEPYNVIGIGPGLGQHTDSVQAMQAIFESINVPLVLDADALNIVAQNQLLQKKLPSNTIITPHVKEFERLTNITCKNDFERHLLIRQMAIEKEIYIILKGAYTAVACPDGTCYFNSTGNPGMATAGSGDALTGIITSLIAQQYDLKSACILGVYLHGLAADIAVNGNESHESLIASDIIKNLGIAFKKISTV